MRYRQDAPRGVMEALFTRLALALARDGYAVFNLGLAPLSFGDAAGPFARAVERLAAHARAWYDFHGLAAFKAKFRPRWEPAWLAYESPADLLRVIHAITEVDWRRDLLDWPGGRRPQLLSLWRRSAACRAPYSAG